MLYGKALEDMIAGIGDGLLFSLVRAGCVELRMFACLGYNAIRLMAVGMARLLSPRSLPLMPVRFFLREVFLERFAGSLHAFHGHHDHLALVLGSEMYPFACSRSIATRNRAPSMLSPILVFLEHCQGEQRQHHLGHFVLVVFHRTPGLEFAYKGSTSGLRPPPDRRRTKPGRNIGYRAHGVSTPHAASSRNPRRINTFTRRAPYSAPAGTC